jgi:hypothetical protein
MPDVVKGDTFSEIHFTIKQNGAAINLTDVSIECKFKKGSKKGALTKDISTDEGISIVNASEGRLKIDAFLLDWSAGIYHYDIQFTNTLLNTVNTYVGGTIKVNQDVT